MKEICHGIIPLLLVEDKWKVLLIQHQKDLFWGFPKGHSENGEGSFETGARELFEETGLKVIKKLSSEALIEKYSYKKGKVTIDKEVCFYPCLTTDEVTIDQKEIIDFKWCSLDEALSLISFKEGKDLVAILNKSIKTFYC